MRTGFDTDIDFWRLAVPQIAVGLGIPFFFIPLMALGTGGLPPDEVASGASMISFSRTTAGAFAVSLTTTSWADKGAADRVHLLEQAPGAGDALQKLQDSGLSAGQALQSFEGLVQTQAVMLATNEMFQIISAMFLLAACVVWIAPRPRRGARAPAGGH